MKRFCYLVVLMALSSSAHAGNSFSFVVGGHLIRIEAPRYCNSPSCVSVSIPGIYETRRGRDRYDGSGGALEVAKPAKTPAPAVEQVSVRPVVPPASKPTVEPVPSAPPPPAIVKPAVSAPRESAAPPPSGIQPPDTASMPPPVEPSIETAPPAPVAVPQVIKTSHEVDDELADTPLGDWQTEANKGLVRIERCGRALCGYVLDPSSGAKGETVLIDMKPKASSEWSGNIYSRDSGNTYYATIAMKGPNSLRVEACALGRFFCSGNVWNRIDVKKLITSRQISPEPRS